MFKLGEREKRVTESMEGSEELLSEGQNVPYLSFLRHQKSKPLVTGSPVSRLNMLSSENSPSSSSFSNGRCSTEDGLPYTPPVFEEAKYQSPYYWNGLCLDSKSLHDSYGKIDELGLAESMYRINIREERNGGGGMKMKGFQVDPDGYGISFDDGSVGGFLQHNTRKYGFNNEEFDVGGCKSSPFGAAMNSEDDITSTFHGFQGGFDKGVCHTMGSFPAQDQPNHLCCGFDWCNNQNANLLHQRREQGKIYSRGVRISKPSASSPYLKEAFVRPQHFNTDPDGGTHTMDTSGCPWLIHSTLDVNICNPLSKGMLPKEKATSIPKSGVPQSVFSVEGTADTEAFNRDNGFETCLGHCSSRVRNQMRCAKKNCFSDATLQNLRGENVKLDICGGMCENNQRLSGFTILPNVPSISSLAEIQGYIYLMAQDQNGCRFLQRIFDEGTSRDVQLIFDEIIDHIVELMLKPFGNYVIQKLLDVCNEEQRFQIVHMVTKEPGQLINICLNTYGTRVVQKLIETLKTRQQISLVVLALKPGFLDLTKDQNGNHVIQRCLQCLSDEVNKFIFDAAAKFCVEIATHRHGCCVMQRCIAHSKGKSQDRLITEISNNGLLLAQDPFGNYVVQFIIELKSPSAVTNLLSQFKGHYVHLSTQKFSSHVVEKCLKYFEESRAQIICELLSVSHFEQLLQDPYANYVIQSALVVTKGGSLYSSLVEAVRPHMMLRTSPYCKRIFSRNLLRK
ncbi:hypothetical protein K2173_011170 [Erythroxylum novogranatense]|uniref:PUM-HD domain-containing protein n=1 Tax=Erythroxylum novogranatense TaxID=1862640 RepID=A0AAV8T900_9ROSI|nr:hypothetical protein K2173_011170 [Erythroxylum novogranatense]